MDAESTPPEEAGFEAFIDRELKRGTNFITVVGGEPSLQLGRLKKLHDNFHINVATNGLIKIPWRGFEALPIGVSVWGNHATDKFLRGNGKLDAFGRALENYRDDPFKFSVNKGLKSCFIRGCIVYVHPFREIITTLAAEIAQVGKVHRNRPQRAGRSYLAVEPF